MHITPLNMTKCNDDGHDDDDPNKLHSNWIPRSVHEYDSFGQLQPKENEKIPALIVNISDLSRI